MSMDLLLTNDDGFDSPGIQTLAEALRSRGGYRVFVLAPDKNRSGVSHCLDLLSGPVSVKSEGPGLWSCSGYPGDCVLSAVLSGTPCKPEAVISGINKGANLGTDLVYSGTAAAARQAALMGVPAVAFSLAGDGDFQWNMAAEYAAGHLEEFLSLWKEDVFINVNIPNSAGGPGGMVHTWPALKDYHDQVTWMKTSKGIHASSGMEWCFLVPGTESVEDEKGSDYDAVSRNLVSVSSVFIHPVVAGDLCPGAPGHASTGKRRN
jgi:5'-nucleotidase